MFNTYMCLSGQEKWPGMGDILPPVFLVSEAGPSSFSLDAPQFGFDEVDSLVDLIIERQLTVGRRAVRQRGSDC